MLALGTRLKDVKMNLIEFTDFALDKKSKCACLCVRMCCSSTTLSGVDSAPFSTTSSSSWPDYYRETAPSLSPGTACVCFCV